MRPVVFAFAIGGLVVGACGGGTPTSPTSPAPASDTTWHRLIDGAGNEGLVTFRWLELSKTEAGNLVNFQARVCYGLGEGESVTPIPNPTNNPNLSEMRLLVIGSIDGVQQFGTYSAISEGAPYAVQNGSCVTIKRKRGV